MSFSRFKAAMSLFPEKNHCVTDGALIETGLNVQSSLSPTLLTAAEVSNVRNSDPEMLKTKIYTVLNQQWKPREASNAIFISERVNLL